jgi:hypothetical protein
MKEQGILFNYFKEGYICELSGIMPAAHRLGTAFGGGCCGGG